MLPAQRSASLRHVGADDGRDEGVGSKGYDAGFQRAHDVPSLPWHPDNADGAGPCADHLGALVAAFVVEHAHANRWTR